MATEFLMPKLGLTMEEGTIVEWLVADGAEVSPGTPVMLIETDKVESEVEVSSAGRLHRLAAAGDTFPCGAVIGLLLAEGEAPPAPPTSDAPSGSSTTGGAAAVHASTAPAALLAAPPTPAGGDRLLASPNARRVAALRNVDLRTVRGTGPLGRIVSEDVEAAADRPRPVRSAPPTAGPTGSLVPATVAGRQLADLLGVDLAAVPVDPADGRVTREGVAAHVRALLRAASPPAPTGSAAPLLQTPTKLVRLAGMRGTIAKRMHSSLQEMAQLTLTMDADLDAVVADREQRKAAGAAPGFTDYIVAAAARALRQHPIVNAQLTPDGIALLPDVDVGVAVAVDSGLMVPVVRRADRLGLDSLSAETSRLAEAARSGTLGLEDLEGGTFSVTALGMFGVDAFTPVINPPNVAILGVGRIRDDLAIVDGEVGTVKRLTLSLTWDHRVLDGAPAASFCQTIVGLLADPSQLA